MLTDSQTMAEFLRSQLPAQRYTLTPLEEDFNTPPAGTIDYEGRAFAFHVTDNLDGCEFRVTVEEVTLDDPA